MQIDIDIDQREINRLLDDLRAYQLRKRGQILALIEETAIAIERDAKKFAPVDTGRMRASIRHHLEGLAATVGTDVEYAEAVEYGTSNRPPQAYLGPAYDRHIGTFMRELIRILEDD